MQAEVNLLVTQTFDLVMFFGLLYHLEYPLMGVEKVTAMTSGTLLVASSALETTHLLLHQDTDEHQTLRWVRKPDWCSGAGVPHSLRSI